MKNSIINEITKELNSRYTVKAYDPSKRISAEELAIITDVLRMSASSINSQPWKFIVIESDAAKQRFHDTFEYKYPTNQPHAKNASHIILFANKAHFNRDDFKKRLDVEVAEGRLTQEKYEQLFDRIFSFAEMNMDENGYNGHWTKAQTYIALGGALAALARLGIDSTPMEGVDAEMIGKIFAEELGEDYECTFALAIGYHSDSDYNHGKPKARLPKKDVIQII